MSESMGSDTKKYLASFISDLRTKSTIKTTKVNTNTPPTAKTTQSNPVLFAGQMNESDGSKTQKIKAKASKIELSDKEKEMLKAFSKLK